MGPRPRARFPRSASPPAPRTRAAALTWSSVSRISPRSGLDAIALRSGLRTWTRPPLAKGEGGTGPGRGGEERREKRKNTHTHTKKPRASWRRSPCWRRGLLRPVHGERRGARALIAGSPSPPARRRRRPPAPTPSAQSLPPGDAWSRLWPLVAGRSGRSCKLLLSHHLAVTASQKRPHLAAAGTRDGRGRCRAPGGKGGAERLRPESGAACGRGRGEDGRRAPGSPSGGGRRRRTARPGSCSAQRPRGDRPSAEPARSVLFAVSPALCVSFLAEGQASRRRSPSSLPQSEQFRNSNRIGYSSARLWTREVHRAPLGCGLHF